MKKGPKFNLQHIVADAVAPLVRARNLPQNLSMLVVTVAVLAIAAVFACSI